MQRARNKAGLERSLAIQVLEEMAKPRRTVIARELAQRTYVAFPQECGWCGAAFTKAYRKCPMCGSANSIHPPAHNSRWHFSDFR